MKVSQVLPGNSSAWFAIYRACREAMARDGVHQWMPDYPSQDVIVADMDFAEELAWRNGHRVIRLDSFSGTRAHLDSTPVEDLYIEEIFFPR